MKTLVTGGAGFIGSHIVDRLITDGHEVLVIDNLSTGKKSFVNDKAKFVEEDILNLNPAHLARVMEDFGVEYVFHEAALPRLQLSLDKPIDTFEANTLMTALVLEASRLAKVKKVIYASSSSVYGQSMRLPLIESMNCNPITPYAYQKYMSELLCRCYALNFDMTVIALRYFNVYGLRASTTGAYKLVMSIFKEQQKNGKELTIYGNGTQTRDFTYISDVVEANMLAIHSNQKGYHCFNICSGTETSINDVAFLFSNKTKNVPNPRINEEMRKVGSYRNAEIYLKYKPKVNLQEGITRYLNNEL